MPETLKPPLKWAGGKRWLVPLLYPLWKPYRRQRLVEPFCGGLSVALGLQAEEALLNDINILVINFYQWLKQGLKIQLPMQNNRLSYYRCRERLNDLIRAGRTETREAAELFYYLNRTCYNGLCRFNRKGEFNVPMGRYQKINYTADFLPYRLPFKNWDFQAADFEKISVNPDDFIYADPPYDVQFTDYAKEAFTWEDQVRLAEWLAAHHGPVVLSNQATERIITLYKSLHFKMRFLNGPRRINCTGDRSPAREVLAVKGL